LFWKQNANLKYDPAIVVDDQAEPMETHLKSQVERYNSVVIIDLLKHSGVERVLEDSYTRCFQSLQQKLASIRKETFDLARAYSERGDGFFPMLWSEIHFVSACAHVSLACTIVCALFDDCRIKATLNFSVPCKREGR
jgi:hypothetical protein